MGTILHLPQAKTLPGSVIHPETYPDNSRQTCLLGRPLTYLACPYTHPLPAIMESRFETCTRAAAWLIQEQEWNVFSPITHSHPMATIGGCRADWNSWAQIDREYLECSRRLVVLCLPGWSTSVGVTAEIRIAESQGLSILYLKMDGPGWRFIKGYEAVDGLVVSPGAQQALAPDSLAKACEQSGTISEVAKQCIQERGLVVDTTMPTKVPDGMDNPKDLIGMTKPPLRLVPAAALLHFAKVMELGARKYGPYNWRQKAVRFTVYLEAAMRHILSALDGEEIDPESGQPHTAHAGACMAILLDARAIGKLIDDRPTPGAAARLIKEMTVK